MKLTKFRKVLLIISAVFAVLFVGISYHPGASGTVVDAETGKPIEGAVVMVEWIKTKGLPGLTYHQVHKIVEVETDADGKFSVGGTFHPLADSPTVVIYKKGYVAWRNDFIFPSWEKRIVPRGYYGLIIRLEKFKNGYSHDKHLFFIQSGIRMYEAKKHKLRNAVQKDN